MGKPILYCGDCGRSLREEDFDRRKAGYLQNAPYCLACRPDAVPPEKSAPPPSSARHRPVALPTSTPSRSLPVSSSKGVPTAVAAAIGGGVVLLLIVVAVSSSPKPSPPAPPTPRPAPAPVVARAPDVEREPAPRPRPAPPRPVEPDVAPPPPDPALVLERYLADIRAIRQDDPEFKRADEVRSMLRRAVQLAGTRKAEVEAQLAGYEKELLKPAPAAAPQAAPAGGTVVSFTLVDAETDKPVPGYDPIASETSIDLLKLGLTKIDFRINTSPKQVGSMETVIDKEKPHTENSFPYSFTTNAVATGFTGWTPAPGRHTLKCRVWSLEGKKGTAGPWVTFNFTVVDPR